MPNEHANKGCGAAGFKLFGVQIAVAEAGESSIRKSKSLGNLEALDACDKAAVEPSGYLSDGLIHQSSKSHERKKGKPWSEEEHRSFLVGLEKLGKGDWKGIASKYVPSRNSSQVASHAQKYFIRKAATEKKRRRSSVFDIPLNDNQPSQVNPGSQSDKSPLSSQPASNSAASLKHIGELKAPNQGSPSASVASSERPPLSPMRRRGIPDFRSMVYSPRVSSLNQGFATQPARPTVSWVPFVSFSNQNNVYLPNMHGNLAPTCAKFLAPPSIAKSPQTGSSQADATKVPTTTNNELELNLNIRKLTL